MLSSVVMVAIKTRVRKDEQQAATNIMAGIFTSIRISLDNTDSKLIASVVFCYQLFFRGESAGWGWSLAPPSAFSLFSFFDLYRDVDLL